jgi:hypothetical protein
MEQRRKAISDLQVRWRCEFHSKDKDVPCWNENGGGICYTLANHNLGYWAVEIVSNINLPHKYHPYEGADVWQCNG